MTLTPYARGYHDGAQAIVRLVVENMRSARPGARRTIALDRFDALVERHLEAVGLPPDPQAVAGPGLGQDARTAAGPTAEACGDGDDGDAAAAATVGQEDQQP